MILIGSQALKLVAPELLSREPKDFDLIATHAEFKEFVKRNKFTLVVPQNAGSKMICRGPEMLPVEVEIAWPGTSAEILMSLVKGDEIYVESINSNVSVASLDVLFALKASHRYKKNSVHFLKTMKDYKAMKSAGASINEDLKEFYRLREKETYNYSHPNLNTSKGKFFNPSEVEYKYEHDTIHLAMAHLDRPAYTYFQEGAEVKCDRKLFEALPLQTRLYSVLEESYVLALERSQVPYPGKLTPRQSFLIALEKVCTSIASGWWREFAYDHYNEVLALYSDDYVNKFQKGIDNGVVLLYNGSYPEAMMALAI